MPRIRMSGVITILPHMPSWRFFYIVDNYSLSLNFNFNACSFGVSFPFLAHFSVPFKSNCKTVVLSNVFYFTVKVNFDPVTGHEDPEGE
jgi:hypothetical protein